MERKTELTQRPIVDCTQCANRGKIRGLSQETYCSQCIHHESWKKDWFQPKESNHESL